MNTTIKNTQAKIGRLARNFTSGKALVSELSREVLDVYYGVSDASTIGTVNPVNKLLLAVAPQPKVHAQLVSFFRKYLAAKFDKTLGCFTVKQPKKFDESKQEVEFKLQQAAWNVYTDEPTEPKQPASPYSKLVNSVKSSKLPVELVLAALLEAGIQPEALQVALSERKIQAEANAEAC